MSQIEPDTPPGKVSKEEKKRLEEKFGRPPKREDPLEVKNNNLVYVCSAGGPIYNIYRGRVTDPDVSEKKTERYSKSMGTHDGVREQGDKMVKVRYGPSTMESSIVPIKRVLEIIGEESTYNSGERYYDIEE